jgi:hypothetical protein
VSVRVFPPDSDEIVTIGPISIRILEDGSDTEMARYETYPAGSGPTA